MKKSNVLLTIVILRGVSLLLSGFSYGLVYAYGHDFFTTGASILFLIMYLATLPLYKIYLEQ